MDTAARVREVQSRARDADVQAVARAWSAGAARPAGAAGRARVAFVAVLAIALSILPMVLSETAAVAGGRVEQEPTAAELAQQKAQVSRLRTAEQRQAANVDDAQSALQASAALAGQALENSSVAARTLQGRQATEQQTQDALAQAQQDVLTSQDNLGRWARQAYQGGTGLAGNTTLNTLFEARDADDVGTDLVILRRIGTQRARALDTVVRDQQHAGQSADTAARASQNAADAAIGASSARNAADQAVAVQRRLLGLAETTLAQAQNDTTAAVRKQAALQAAAARALARRAQASADAEPSEAQPGTGSGAARDNRVTGQVGSCAGGDVGLYPNGEIPISALCPLWSTTGHYLRADAAFAFDQLSHDYADRFGGPICLTDSYRSYAAQVSLFARKPALAAVPGTSNHGWGTAVDLCGGIENFGTVQHQWMLLNAPLYGWFHPGWAEPTGSRPEPWHWEYGGD